ncbi:hypothetical protein [Streptomyces sp. NRRL F-5650]|uniref:hypothetical protein n=1 Tax=Streptomyces sp. NRRL F-5650 TaxID=1463868 RepID=UPI000AD80A2A|nr:hypothetical protein [Streptomyces sp. NRRL F-5650]
MTLNNGTTTPPDPTAGAARTPGYAGTLAAACGAVFVAQVANALRATTNMLRGLGSALGPVVVGAVALSNAGSAFAANLSGADLPPAQVAAAREIAEAGGPIAVNSLPPGTPGSAAHSLALGALGSGFSTAFLVCAAAAAVAAALTAFGLRVRSATSVGIRNHIRVGPTGARPGAQPAMTARQDERQTSAETADSHPWRDIGPPHPPTTIPAPGGVTPGQTASARGRDA